MAGAGSALASMTRSLGIATRNGVISWRSGSQADGELARNAMRVLMDRAAQESLTGAPSVQLPLTWKGADIIVSVGWPTPDDLPNGDLTFERDLWWSRWQVVVDHEVLVYETDPAVGPMEISVDVDGTGPIPVEGFPP